MSPSGEDRSAPPKLPSLPRRAANYAKAVVKHRQAGRPTRTSEQVANILRICRRNTCGQYRETPRGGKCAHKKCGCTLEMKARWATEACPLGLWKATAVVPSQSRQDQQNTPPPKRRVRAPKGPFVASLVGSAERALGDPLTLLLEIEREPDGTIYINRAVVELTGSTARKESIQPFVRLLEQSPVKQARYLTADVLAGQLVDSESPPIDAAQPEFDTRRDAELVATALHDALAKL